MPQALSDTGVTTVAADASRQPQQYTIGAALTAPRYPSNIYYNASNWPDQLNEYNTLYVSQGDSIGNGETGHCADTSATTCRPTPATEADFLASESHIMLTHVLANNPRVGYAHQTDLIGPATENGQDYGYTILDLISNMLSQYNSWFNSSTPLDQMTDVSEAQVLAEQGAWATALGGSSISATETNGVVTVTNAGPSVEVPITVPPGTTANGAAFGTAYGGELSDWVNLATGATETLDENVAPTIISGTSATSIVGIPFSFTVSTTGEPHPALTESGALPTGLSFTDNGNGMATIVGTAASGTGGSYPIAITATNASGTTTQSFTLTNAEAPTITSASAASFSVGVAGTYTVTTTGYPAPTVTESGALPTGLSFSAGTPGTTGATISGTPAAGTAGTYPVTIAATNISGSTSTLALTITVGSAAAPTLVLPTADFTLNSSGAVAITATGAPTPAITETGAMPAGLTFTDEGSGTALISGTPTTPGTTNITVTAANGVNPAASQTLTIVVGEAPTFTSASTATAPVGATFSFTVTTNGYPGPSFGWDDVPPGLTFTDNGNGTATLAGTPTTPGTYAMALSAVNSYGTAQQTLTVTVTQAPAITSVGSATFTAGAGETFMVTTAGSPTPAITESGALPSGVTFTDNGNGTATLTGTATTGSEGSYPLTINAANGVAPDATQSFTLTVDAAPTAPAITSGDSTTFTVGAAGDFSVLTTGNPAATISESGVLPDGVTFTDPPGGMATLAGTPASGSQGSYPITISASNGVSPDASQSFTLTVNPATEAPVITSAGSTAFQAKSPGTFTVTTTGLPAATISATSSPALPSGVSFKDNGDGTATLSGTPPEGSQGTYTLTIEAANTAGTATQSFALTVNAAPVAPAITSASTATFTVGAAGSFGVMTTGSPTAAVTEAGTLPPGLSFVDNGDGTAVLSGTPTSAGTTTLTVKASNGNSPDASQVLTVTIEAASSPSTTSSTPPVAPPAFAPVTGPSSTGPSSTGPTSTGPASTAPFAANAPAFTSASSVATTVGHKLTFRVSASGYPVPTLKDPTLPNGLKWTDNGNGTATIWGIPMASAAGRTRISLSAVNSAGHAQQFLTITVGRPAGISSSNPPAATAGRHYAFTVTAFGYPAPTITESGKLPAGLTFIRKANGYATLQGVPLAGSGGVHGINLTVSNSLGKAVVHYSLTVREAPRIVSPVVAHAVHNHAFVFTVRTAGYPRPSLTHTVLPAGLKWANNGNGTATISGRPTPGAVGLHRVTVSAKNPYATTSVVLMINVS